MCPPDRVIGRGLSCRSDPQVRPGTPRADLASVSRFEAAATQSVYAPCGKDCQGLEQDMRTVKGQRIPLCLVSGEKEEEEDFSTVVTG